MLTALLRRLVLSVLLAAIPVQGMAAAAMLYCCDRAGAADASHAHDASAHAMHDAQDAGTRDAGADGGTHEAADRAVADHDAHAANDAGHGGHSQQAKCGACAAFCSGGAIVSRASGFNAPLPCSSPMAAAPATHFSSFLPDLAERPPLALL